MSTTLIQKAIVSQFITEAFERFEVEYLPYLISRDFVAHPWEALGLPRGPEGMGQVVRRMRTLFSKAQVTVGDIVAEGDRVVARYLFEADYVGELAGVPATGRRVRTSAILIARMEGGKIAEVWREQDQLGMMRQLGMAPLPEVEMQPAA